MLKIVLDNSLPKNEAKEKVIKIDYNALSKKKDFAPNLPLLFSEKEGQVIRLTAESILFTPAILYC